MIDLDKALKCAIKASEIGREVLLEYFGRLSKVTVKDQAGLVSEADQESERLISEYLRRELPEISILGEESSYKKPGFGLVPGARAKGLWLIDPLDGTTNYVHKLPIYCISIGLEIENEIKVAVVNVPVFDKLYTSIRGRGSFVNGEKMSVSDRTPVSNALLATGFSSYDKDALASQLKVFAKFVGEARGVRRAGSAAYDLCLVAEGVFDGYWERNLQPWDSAAGSLLITEAGGHVTNYAGEKYDPFDTTLVAGNPAIHKILREEIHS
jgi:myo-inositol-1(or 4)-monophosphatase